MTVSKLKHPPDDQIAAQATDNDLLFLALAGKSALVRLLEKQAENVDGLVAIGLLPSLLAAADTLLGPIQTSFVTIRGAGGKPIASSKNVSSAQLITVAP